MPNKYLPLFAFSTWAHIQQQQQQQPQQAAAQAAADAAAAAAAAAAAEKERQKERERERGDILSGKHVDRDCPIRNAENPRFGSV